MIYQVLFCAVAVVVVGMGFHPFASSKTGAKEAAAEDAVRVYEASKNEVRRRFPDAFVPGSRLNTEIRAYTASLQQSGHPMLNNPRHPMVITEFVSFHIKSGGQSFVQYDSGSVSAQVEEEAPLPSPPQRRVVSRVASRPRVTTSSSSSCFTCQ